MSLKKYRNHTIQEYLDVLSKKAPVPGGGSASALVGAVGTALLCMAARYSQGKGKLRRVENKIRNTIQKCEEIRKRLCELIDRDAQAYLKIVKARNRSEKEKQTAFREANKILLEICRLCYKAVQLAPFLVKEGNKGLIGDVEGAVEMLLAAFNAARANLEFNQ